MENERFSELAHALQYGTAEEAGDALRELIDMKEQGEIPAGSPVEKLVENLALRQKIEEQREDAVAREISGEDPAGFFEPESQMDAEGVLIEHNASYRQRMLRPAVRLYPNLMNTPLGLQAVGEMVDAMVEAGEGDFDDEGTYIEAARRVYEMETAADRLDANKEQQEAFREIQEHRDRRLNLLKKEDDE